VKQLSFPFRNAGNTALKITSVDAGCGCLTPSYPDSVGPGKSGQVAFRFAPGSGWAGRTEKHIEVFSNDPRNPKTELRLNCNVIPFVDIQPANLMDVPYKRGATYERTVRLVPRKGSKITISKLKSDNKLVTPELIPPKAGDATRTYLLKMKVGPCPGPGDWTARVSFATSEPTVPQLQVVVAGLAMEGPVAIPKEVFVATAPRNMRSTQVAQFQVTTRTRGMKVLKVDTGTPYITASVTEKVPGQLYTVLLERGKPWKPGDIDSTIRVTTDSADYPEITLPFHITVQ